MSFNWEARDIAIELKRIADYLRYQYFTVESNGSTELHRIDKETEKHEMWCVTEGDPSVGMSDWAGWEEVYS